MKEHPILFSGEMVRAILEGRKTQTRRIIKPQPFEYDRVQTVPGITSQHYPVVRIGRSSSAEVSVYEWEKVECGEISTYVLQCCPYGKPGDRLWVRETWAQIWKHEGCIGEDTTEPYNCSMCSGCRIEYWADTKNSYPGDWPESMAKEDDEAPRWKPSIHMPRWASRLELEIANIRVERLNDITEEDAKAEGAKEKHNIFHDAIQAHIGNVAIRNFAVLWDSIYSKRGLGWDKNPLVWVIEFKRISNV